MDQKTLDDATIAAHAESVRADGYAVVEDAIDPGLCDEIATDLLRLEHALGIVPANNAFEGLHTTRIYNLLVHGPLYERIPVHPNVLPIVEQVLDPGLLISSLSSISIGSDESAQPIHSDDQLIPLPKPHPALICNTMWAITDFTERNGATRLVPGTHLADHSPNLLEQYDSIPAEMPKGSVLVWVGSLWHGGGANTDRSTPSRHCHELLRRLHSPAGEPAVGDPEAGRPALPTAPPGARRVLHIQRPDGAHRQAAPREAASWDRPARRPHMGLRAGRPFLTNPS